MATGTPPYVIGKDQVAETRGSEPLGFRPLASHDAQTGQGPSPYRPDHSTMQTPGSLGSSGEFANCASPQEPNGYSSANALAKDCAPPALRTELMKARAAHQEALAKINRALDLLNVFPDIEQHEQTLATARAVARRTF